MIDGWLFSTSSFFFLIAFLTPQDILPISRKLGERVIENSASKLKPHLAQEVETHGIVLSDYSKVVASICQETAGDAEQNEVHDADEDVVRL